MWWVIPGKLAGVRRPTAEEISALKTAGIGAIVSVMDDAANLDLYAASNMPYLWLPTTGGTAPTQEQAEQFRQFVDAENARSHAVAVHCTSGRRRTGTLLAAYLIATGATAENALNQILQANPAVKLREAQVAFLRELQP
nr:dual specificity protein phosphatase family protein [Pseudanabaena sp. FACHB-2040]